MLERFLRIRDELIEVSQDDRSHLIVNRSQAFKNKVLRYCQQLIQIDLTTKELQTRNIWLSHCQNALDLHCDDVRDGFHYSNSPFFLCVLKNRYITNDAKILYDLLFESGVWKIQDNRVAGITNSGKIACQTLLLPVENSDDDLVVISDNFLTTKSACTVVSVAKLLRKHVT